MVFRVLQRGWLDRFTADINSEAYIVNVCDGEGG